jgi:prepilin-type N-terminal cleavage/methylation domain-containing protein
MVLKQTLNISRAGIKMSKANMKKEKGFTLIEILLVLVIVGILIFASANYVQQRALQMRMDRTSTQMQQILNAGLAYYVANGAWPANMAALQGTYLPPGALRNPWGNTYDISSTTALFYVYTRVNTVSAKGANAAATVIAGSLPMAYTSNSAGTPPAAGSACSAADTSCYIVASVNIPGQNLNNARAVNFAGLYKHGACVPVPKCPVDATGNTMTPQVMIVPSSVSGVNDADTNPQNIYPISSFTAYATGPSATPPACSGSTATTCTPTAGQAADQYWRACLQVITEKGVVTSSPGAGAWGQFVTLMAVTRCSVTNESAGSQFTVFSN